MDIKGALDRRKAAFRREDKGGDEKKKKRGKRSQERSDAGEQTQSKTP